ncbi:MAG: peptide chain release factor N(5)-glutamine methyltransferase [Gammaproteobacteria bacterium]|nr:peptide chain release factor N(5)-glutamine methyltransferase [Gammaproteobacteria bacterium]
MQTVRELLQFASTRLGASDTPRLDAEVLLAAVLGTDRSRLYAHPEMAAPQGSSADFLRLLNNRGNGFPVAYLTGEKEFRSITFRVNRHTLIPRPETELVVEAALEQIPDQYRAEVLDLGTGSGAIAVAVASERPDCAVTAADLSIDALAVARENAAANHVANISFEQSDWFGSLHNRRFDAIICNPPYVRYPDTGLPPEEIRYEPRLALDGGHDGTACIRIVIASGLRHINPGGFIIIEHAHNQGGFVREQFRTNHYRNITTSLDHAGHERYTSAFRA